MTSLTQWTWVWASFVSWWWTRKASMLQSMGSQRVKYDWALNWTELNNKPQLGASQVVLVVKNLPATAGDLKDKGLILGSGRSPGGGHGYPLQYYYLENSMDRRAWWAIAHRVAKSWVTKRLSSRSSWGMEKVHRVTTLLLFSCSVVSDSATPWSTAQQASLSITISQSRLKLLSIESVMTSNHLILCCPLLILPSIFPSIRVFSNELAFCIRWPKY